MPQELVIEPISARPAPQPMHAPQPREQTARILVVEDEPLTAQIFALALTRNGLQVEVCKNGLRVLERVAAQRPSAIVLDMSLPFRSGAQILRDLRKAGWRDLPVLVVSGRPRDEVDVTSADLWPGAWVEKPVRPRDLVALVREFLPDAR